jgi:hypothetical protein
MSWLSRSNNRFNRELSQSRPGPDRQYCLKPPTFGEDPAVMNQILAHLGTIHNTHVQRQRIGMQMRGVLGEPDDLETELTEGEGKSSLVERSSAGV